MVPLEVIVISTIALIFTFLFWMFNHQVARDDAFFKLKSILSTASKKELEDYLLLYEDKIPKKMADKIKLKIDDLTIKQSYYEDNSPYKMSKKRIKLDNSDRAEDNYEFEQLKKVNKKR